MYRALLAGLTAAAALALPAAGAHAGTCVYTPTTGTTASVCVNTEGVWQTSSGDYTTASSFSVTINGTRYGYCIARTTVGIGGVTHDPRTVYPC